MNLVCKTKLHSGIFFSGVAKYWTASWLLMMHAESRSISAWCIVYQAITNLLHFVLLLSASCSDMHKNKTASRKVAKELPYLISRKGDTAQGVPFGSYDTTCSSSTSNTISRNQPNDAENCFMRSVSHRICVDEWVSKGQFCGDIIWNLKRYGWKYKRFCSVSPVPRSLHRDWKNRFDWSQ